MLMLKKLVLQFGAIYLLVSLKTQAGWAKSVSRSEQQKQETHSRSHEDTTELIKADEQFTTLVPSSYSLGEAYIKGSERNHRLENSNSSFSENTSTDNNARYSTDELTAEPSVLDYPGSANVFAQNASTDSEASVIADRTSSNVTEEKQESIVEAGRRAIKNLGADLKKLKKNVANFKQNLQKLLFESDRPGEQRVDHSNRSGNVNDSKHYSHNAESFNASSPSGSDRLWLKSGHERHPNARVSAVASHMNEASKKMGEFLQKQYWDSKANDPNRQGIVNRGLENLVPGVDSSEGGLPPSQVLQQWVNLEESFRESVDAVVRQALPLLVRASSEMELSSGCYTSFFQLLLGLRRLRPWAFQMIDAFGKPPAGMLQGTITSFGAYDECVNIVAMSDSKKKARLQQYFRGKYCTVEIKPPLPPKPQYYTMYQPVSILANFSNGDDNVIRQAARQAHAFYFLTYRMDICVPSTCTQEDVYSMAQFAAKYIDIEVAVPRCSVKEDLKFDRSQVAIICIVITLLAFVLLATTLDTMREIFQMSKNVARCMSSAFSKFLLSFSINTNVDMLLNTDSAQNGLDLVHGMRFFGMGWLVLGHTYFNSNVQMYGNLRGASAFAEGFFFQIIVNSTVSIDTFFFISAVLLSYLTLQSASKHGFYSIPRLFMRRLMRVLPPYMMVIGATLILPHLGSGPFWNETVDPVVDACKRNWWTNVLFINNFVTTPTERCLEHSWYFSCDFQLFVIALFILLALIKRPALGMALNIIMIMVSMVMTGLLTYHYQVPPTLLASFPDPEERKFLNHVIISKPFCHLGPYCVGLATGYFFYRCKEIKLKAYHHILGWGSAVSVTAAVVYGVLEWNKGNFPSPPAALAYAATHRTAWALGLSWITVVCVAGYGGIIHRILSWKVFIPLSRLTYMVYLIHPLIQYILTGYIRERLQTNHIILAYFFFGHITMSYALSAACYFLFDGPVEAVMRLIMGDCTAPVPELAKTKAGLKKVANNNLKTEKERNV